MKCRIGITMTKAMHKRLMYYKRLEMAQGDEELENTFEGAEVKIA